MHYDQLSFSLSLFKFFLIVDDSFSRLTTRMIVHDSRIAVRKHAATLFRHQKFILLQVCLLGGHLVFTNLMRKELGTRCSRDFACMTAGELSSTIMNFFGRLTT